jgi:hypothetical protein
MNEKHFAQMMAGFGKGKNSRRKERTKVISVVLTVDQTQSFLDAFPNKALKHVLEDTVKRLTRLNKGRKK